MGAARKHSQDFRQNLDFVLVDKNIVPEQLLIPNEMESAVRPLPNASLVFVLKGLIESFRRIVFDVE